MYFYKACESIYAKLFKKEISMDVPVLDENEEAIRDENNNIITNKETDYVYGWEFFTEQPEKNFIKIKTMSKEDEFKILEMTSRFSKSTSGDMEAQTKYIVESDKWFSEKCDFSNFNVKLSLELSQALFIKWQESSRLSEQEMDFLVL